MAKRKAAKTSRRPTRQPRSRTVVNTPPAKQPRKHVTAVEYDWTADRDQVLRERFNGKRQGAGSLGVIADALGWPFHIVKQRARHLGLLKRRSSAVGQGPSPRSGSSVAATSTETPERPSPAAEDRGESIEARTERLAAIAATLRHAVCPNVPRCYTRATWDPRDSLEQLHTQGFIYGLDPETEFPVCPNCRTTMVAAEPVEAPQAVRQAIAAGDSHQPRLWPDPPFNWQGAYMGLEHKGDEVRELKAIAETAQRAAKKAQKAYAKAWKEKDAMEEALRARRIEKAREISNRVDQVAQPDPPADACIWTANTGHPCRCCTAESPTLVAAAFNQTRTVLADRQSEAHRMFALELHSKTVPTDAELRADAAIVARALPLGGLYGIPVDVVETWSDDERRQVLGWVDGGCDRQESPEILGTPHIAANTIRSDTHDKGKTSDTYQCCADCGARLVTITDENPVGYPSGAAVGLFCTGLEVESRPSAAAEAHA